LIPSAITLTVILTKLKYIHEGSFLIMKKVLSAVIASTALFVSVSHAGSFDGAYIGGGITMSKGEWSETSYKSNGNNENGLNLNIGYGAEFGSFYLGGEFAHMTNLGDFGESNISVPVGRTTVTGKAETSGGSGNFVSLIPGFVVTPDLLIYGRIGRGNFNYDQSAKLSTGQTVNNSQDGTMNFVGAGLRYNFTKKASLVVDYMQGKNAEGDVDVTSQTATIGAQYRF
jgi:predicted porin